MTRLLPITIIALAACALFASVASAKGPFFKAELSGGNLAAPIMIGEMLQPDAMNNHPVDPPASLPSQTYTLTIYDADEHGVIGAEWVKWTYIPAHDANPPLVRYPDGQYKSVSRTLATALEANLPREQLVQPEAEDAGTSVAWWFIPAAVGLGLFVVGGGVAASRMLKRRQAAAA
jgi:hypothetical protein